MRTRVGPQISFRIPDPHHTALRVLARAHNTTLSGYTRKIVTEHLFQLHDSRNQLRDNWERLDGLVRRFLLLCRQEVAIAAGAPGTQQKREELQEAAWKAIAQAVEYSKSEEAAQNAVARLLALRVLGYLIRTGLAIQDSKDKNFIDDLVEMLEDSHGEWATQTKASAHKPSTQVPGAD